MFKKYILTLAGQVLVYISSLLLIPVIVKTSGAEVYGAYVIIISLLGIIIGISSFGAGFSVKRFLPSINNISDRSTVFYPQFYFHILSSFFLGVVMLVFYPSIDKYFLGGANSLNKFLIILYLGTYTLYSQVSDIFRYTHRVNLFNITTTLHPYIFLVVVLLWYTLDNIPSLNDLIIFQVVALATVFILMLAPSIKSIGFKFAWYNKYLFMRDIKYGFPLILVVIFELIISASDRYVIAGYMGLDSVAYYAIAYSVASIPFILPKVIGIVLTPIISKLKDKGEEDKIAPMINLAIFIFCMFIFPFTIGVIILGDPLLSLYVNKEAAAAAGLMPIITMAILFYGVGSILSNILFVDMKTKGIFLSNCAAGSLNLIANILIFSVINNIYVAAWTTFCSYLLYLVLIYRQLDKRYTINFLDIKIIKIALSSFVMAMALYFMKSLNINFYTIEGLVLGVTIGCVVYILSLFVSRITTLKNLTNII